MRINSSAFKKKIRDIMRINSGAYNKKDTKHNSHLFSKNCTGQNALNSGEYKDNLPS